MHKEALEILKLEEKYFKQLKNLFFGNDFNYSILKLEKYIQKNYAEIKLNNVTKNIINTAIERLLRYYCYKNIIPINPYYHLNGADVCYETEDCLFNLDAKTVNLYSNFVDRKPLLIEKNQISFKNKKKYSFKDDRIDFDGFEFTPSLKYKYNNKYTLTFFYKVNYYDDGINFKILENQFYIAPNNLIFKNLFSDNDIISNIKGWDYVKSKKTALIIGDQKLKPIKQKKSSWILFKPKNQDRDLYLDRSTPNKITKDKYSIRSKMKEGYCVTYTGISARMDKNLLVNNYNNLNIDSYVYNFNNKYKGHKLDKSNGKPWIGESL